MAKIAVILSIILAIACTVSGHYCNIPTCKGHPHTACIFQSAYPATSCNHVQGVGLSQDEKIRILNLHNQLRNKVATGQELRGIHGPQLAAINMQQLSWDPELAEIAQRWANQCNFNHDSCRDVPRFRVGQNIAYSSTTGNVNTINVENIVHNWFNEVQHYSRNDVHMYRSSKTPNGQQISHYTQFVWAETNKLGCGAIKYREDKYNRFYLVCNYGPTGNSPGKPVYRTY